MNLFDDYIGIGLLGLGYSGLDAEIRRGIYQYRGPSRKWLLRDFGSGPDKLEECLAGAVHLRCDGFLGRLMNQEQVELLRGASQPVINIPSACSQSIWQSHRLSGEALGRMAAEYFLSLGHRNLAMVAHGPHNVEEEIWKGFVSASEHQASLLVWLKGQGATREVMEYRPRSRTRIVNTMTEWLLEAPKPLALFCTSDEQALRYCDFCTFQGLHVPEDVAVLGTGNVTEFCMMNHIPLSSIALPGVKLGWMLAEELEHQIAGNSPSEAKILAPDRVVVRTSTDQLAMQDPVIASVLARLRHHAAERISITEVCKGLNLNRRSINDRFKKQMGRSMQEELFRIRVQLAKARLLETDQTVYQIALECGFTDPESMSKYFKSWLGCTPSQFRKRGMLQPQTKRQQFGDDSLLQRG